MGYEEYRTRAELDEDEAEAALILEAVDEARTNLAFTLHAMDTHSDQAIVDMWIDKTYDDLRARLTNQQLIRAVLGLVHERAQLLADELAALAGLGDDAEGIR